MSRFDQGFDVTELMRRDRFQFFRQSGVGGENGLKLFVAAHCLQSFPDDSRIAACKCQTEIFRCLLRIFLTKCGICQCILRRISGNAAEQHFCPFKVFPEVIPQTKLKIAQVVFRSRLEQFKIFILNHIRRRRHGHVQIRHGAGLQ